MILAELKTKANSVLSTLWPIIQAREEAYFAKHGRYFGLRWSPSTPIVDGIDTPLVLNLPSRMIDAVDVSFDAIDLPFQIKIDRINQQEPNNVAVFVTGQPAPEPIYGPTGETYEVIARIQLPNGDVYTRSRTKDNVDSGWVKLPVKV